MKRISKKMKENPEFWRGWRERLSSAAQCSGGAAVRVGVGPHCGCFGADIASGRAVLPLALFWVSKLIIDTIYRILTAHQAVGARLWWLVGCEFAIALSIAVLGRLIDYLDTLLAGKYMNHISVRVMEHAASLDLLAYEDPAFYDRLERARVQATDRLYMIQAIGRLIQQVITTITLSISIMLFSPWLLLLLMVGVIPAFVGETHFAFLGYAKNFRQTPVRRQLDYLRILGGSKEAAKELKLFGLRDFLTGRFKSSRPGLRRRRRAGASKAVGGLGALRDRHGGLLHGVRVRGLENGYGRFQLWHADFSGQCDSRREFKPATDFFDALHHCRSGVVSH